MYIKQNVKVHAPMAHFKIPKPRNVPRAVLYANYALKVQISVFPVISHPNFLIYKETLAYQLAHLDLF